jgi:hypothetical protein
MSRLRQKSTRDHRAATVVQTKQTSGNGSRAASGTPRVLEPQERYRMIAEAAYFRAESRGFSNGSAEQDWLEAEAEVDRRLAASP